MVLYIRLIYLANRILARGESSVNIRHIILGLLAQQAMSGYDIKSLFKGLSWLIDTPSYGSLYPTLHALLEEGRVTVSVEPGQGKPSRKLYRITEAGQLELHEQLQYPELPERSIKAFARQLILADCLSPAKLAVHLTRRRSQLEDYLRRRECAAMEQDHGQWLIHDYGTTIAQAELAWLEVRIAELQVEEHEPSP
jgi:PadR family transcriptional regulator, regulatory protein AphA